MFLRWSHRWPLGSHSPLRGIEIVGKIGLKEGISVHVLFLLCTSQRPLVLLVLNGHISLLYLLDSGESVTYSFDLLPILNHHSDILPSFSSCHPLSNLSRLVPLLSSILKASWDAWSVAMLKLLCLGDYHITELTYEFVASHDCMPWNNLTCSHLD